MNPRNFVFEKSRRKNQNDMYFYVHEYIMR